MGLDYGSTVAFAKSWGLIYLVALSAAVTLYALWPANRARFERARQSILEDEDRPGA